MLDRDAYAPLTSWTTVTLPRAAMLARVQEIAARALAQPRTTGRHAA